MIRALLLFMFRSARALWFPPKVQIMDPALWPLDEPRNVTPSLLGEDQP